MTEYVGRPGRPSIVDELELARARSVVRDSKPVSRCHPERPMYAVGLCQHCYAEVVRHRQRTADAQLRGSPTEGFGQDLSPRELEVLTAAGDGLTHKQIAAHLGISEQTVKNHVGPILRKLGAGSLTHAVALHVERAYGTIDQTVAALEYLGHIERNLLRLRRDVTEVIGDLRRRRREATAPAPKAKLEYVAQGPVTLVRNRFRHRGDFCKRGHLFDVANTRINARGCRHCRACARERQARVGLLGRAAVQREKAQVAA